MAKKIKWGEDNWIAFITGGVVNMLKEGAVSTSVLYDSETNSIHVVFKNADKNDPRFATGFADLVNEAANE